MTAKPTIADLRFKCSWEKPFPVNGQGTLVFNTDRKMVPFAAAVEDEQPSGYSIALVVGDNFASFVMHSKDQNGLTQLTKVEGVANGLGVGKLSYWYSYDRENLVIKYGKGYRMEETTLMVYDFLKGAQDPEQVRRDMHPYFNAEVKKFVRQYELPLTTAKAVDVTDPLVEFDKLPLICNLSPLVLDSSKVNLFVLDRAEYIFSASLPAACKELYENIKGCDLNYSENQDEKVLLSDAIRYSIDNGILRDKLIEKQGELSDDPDGTYLRVTLGHSLGKSPGIPYVLEIWPAGHFSPIHNHGNANAVIKVLFGSISINIYNKQTGNTSTEPLTTFEACLGDVTWINRNWYQTHKLHNDSKQYCATIQCYNYDAGDTTYWPYFDYVSDNATIEEFYPNSDFGFREMREKVMAEYTTYIYGTNK